MAFDVSKFLALTVLIAGTGAACSGTDDKDNEATDGGKAGTNTSGKAGQGNDAAGADAGGNGGAAAGGEGGAKTAAGAGGEALGGGGGAGGAPFVGECLGALSAAGGAGGEGAIEVDPSLEGLCSDFYQVDCSDEDFAPAYYVCERTRARTQPAVAIAVADCLSALSAADQCDDAKVSACFEGVKGRGCANPDGAAACAVMKAYPNTDCDAIDLAKCEDIADLINPEAFEGFTGCMEPGNEGWYDDAFTGTCVERLDRCAGLVLE